MAESAIIAHLLGDAVFLANDVMVSTFATMAHHREVCEGVSKSVVQYRYNNDVLPSQ